MRILRISHSGVVDAWRERERVTRSLGHEVHSVTAQAWDEGGTVVRPTPGPDEDVEPVRTLGRHPALFVYDPRPLWRLLAQPWDVLDLHEEPCAIATAEVLFLRALRRSRAPFVLYSAQNLDKRYPLPFRWIERWSLRHASAVSVCNTRAGEIVRRKGLTGRAVLIGLGVDTAAFAARPPFGTPAPRTRVGYVGRLEPHKGVDILLEAISRTPGLTLVVAGAGPEEDRLRARAQQPDLAGRVELVGSVDQRDLPDFYRGLGVLAVPSLTTSSWLEQFGRVAVEAMACGVPVVASDSGALPDVVADAGRLVPPGDAPALADALEEVSRDLSLAAAMRERGIDRARTYDWAEIGRVYTTLYEQVARTPAPVTGRDLEIIIVAYHSPDDLRAALTPLRGLPITVVDNSCDADVRSVCAALEVRYLDPGRNGGFAAGVNHGLAHRLLPDADVLLLNPDAVIDAEGIVTLHAGLLAEPDLASVGPAQVDDEGRPSRVAWPFPTPWGSVAEALGLGRWRRDHYVIGSVLLLRAEALESVGVLDESFFLYAEETDWARRAADIGWRHRVVPEVTAVHIGGGTSSDSSRRDAHFHASQERYHRKHFGSTGWQLTRAATVLGSLVRGVVLRGPRGTAAREHVSRYVSGPVHVETTLLGRPVLSDEEGGRWTS